MYMRGSSTSLVYAGRFDDMASAAAFAFRLSPYTTHAVVAAAVLYMTTMRTSSRQQGRCCACHNSNNNIMAHSALWFALLLSSSSVHATSSYRRHGQHGGRLSQHRVKPSKRRVKYRRDDHAASFVVSKFWIPNDKDEDSFRRRILTEEESFSGHFSANGGGGGNNADTDTVPWRMQTIADEQWEEQEDQIIWSAAVDASSIHRSSPREIKRRRRETVTDQFVGLDDKELSKSLESSNNDTANEYLDEEEGLPGEADGWNVTTDVEYGVEYEVVGGNSTLNHTNQTNATSSTVVTSGTPNNNSTTANLANETNTTDGVDGIVYQPIRIRAILSQVGGGGQFLTESERQFLFQKILSPAMLAWSSALRVDPVLGNLTVDAEQLYDGTTCGPGIDSGQPSVPVPLQHFTEGVFETDLILYLSLGFVEYEEEVLPKQPQSSPPERLPGVGGFRRGGTTHDFNTKTSISTETSNNTTCIGATDPALCANNKNATNSTQSDFGERPLCSGHYVAAASYCSTDQYDRPTAALLHLCIDDEFYLESSVNRNILTVMHEIGHALGFNSQSMAYFRHPDGSPITPRNPEGDVPEAVVECTGPSGGRNNASLPLPSEDILQFRTVRGIRVAQVVTPSVRQVIRNHFNCQELNGAELESGEHLEADVNETDEAGTSSCVGDHWERRLMRTDLMNPLLDDVPFSFRISPLTLALFADSGWYQVDLSRAQFSSGWGRSAGCQFVENSCITQNGDVSSANEQYFCNNVVSARMQGTIDELHGCSPDLSRKAVCSISQYDDMMIPPEFQYFNDTLGQRYGGNEPFIDYCPVYVGFANGQCKTKENQALLRVNKMEQFGAKNSRCISGIIGERTRALCLPIACVMQDQSLMIKTGTLWQKCQYGGQRLVVAEKSSDRVVCPDPRRICPTFYCRRDCLGNGGVCDYVSGECLCNTTTLNGTAMLPCDHVYSDDQVANQLFYDDVAEAGSPLSDYYYPTPEVLDKGDGGGVDSVAKVVLVVAVSFVGALVLFFCVSCRNLCFRPVRNLVNMAWNRLRSRNEDQNDAFEEKDFANKDIMIASMLVDMRIHHPQLELENNPSYLDDFCQESLTEVSVTETESSGQLSKTSEVEIDDSPTAGDDAFGYHVEAPNPQVEVCSNTVTIGITRRRKKKAIETVNHQC